LAPRNRDRRDCSTRLRSILLVLLAMPVVTAAMAAGVGANARQRDSQPARFSDLMELTPANVQGLLPLVSLGVAANRDDPGSPRQQRSTKSSLQVDSLAGVDLRLQRFLEERAHLQLPIEAPAAAPPGATPSPEISYQIGTLAAAAGSVAGAPGNRALRAWDPTGRRLVWSVTEAQPISARALVTAGGLVFYGTTDGWLKALDARNGRTLWQHHAEGRKLDEPFSYRGTDGFQYIAVHSLPRASGDGPQTVLLFALAH
jgi:hypothetical protein